MDISGLWIRRLNTVQMFNLPNGPIDSVQLKYQQNYLGAVQVDKMILTFTGKGKEPRMSKENRACGFMLPDSSIWHGPT